MADALLQQAEEQAARQLRKKMAARAVIDTAFEVYGVVYAPEGYEADVDKMNACILGSPSDPLDPFDPRAYNLGKALNHYYNYCQ
jgi:hypothetical protein